MFDAQSLLGQLAQQIRDCFAFVQFDVPRAADVAILRFLDQAGVGFLLAKKAKIRVFGTELFQVFFVEKILIRFVVAVANFYEVPRQIVRL